MRRPGQLRRRKSFVVERFADELGGVRMRLLAVLAVMLACPALIHAESEPLASLEPWRDWPVRQVAAEAPITEIVTLREVWRLDCGEDSEHLVGRITAAAPGPDGSVLLIDRQLT
jgi:hypothetical protein